MFYTGCINNLRDFDKDWIKVLICRHKVPSVILNKNINEFWIPEFSPSEVLLEYRRTKTISADKFFEMYRSDLLRGRMFRYKVDLLIKKFIKIRKPVKPCKINQSINNLSVNKVKLLANIFKNKDIVFLCYEEDDKECHRSVFREVLSQFGVECKEVI